MNRPAQDSEKLSNLLGALEDDILKMPDAEAATSLDAGRTGLDDVSRLISARLLMHQGQTATPAPQTSPKARPRRSAASKIESRIALLRRLLMARPELSPQLHAVLSDGGTPDVQAVERLIAELVRKGVLPKAE